MEHLIFYVRTKYRGEIFFFLGSFHLYTITHRASENNSSQPAELDNLRSDLNFYPIASDQKPITESNTTLLSVEEKTTTLSIIHQYLNKRSLLLYLIYP
jgi:hypothetical protein